jgi:cystathionine gamma-synthase
VPQTAAPHDGMKFETLAVHAGRRPEAVTGSVAPPLYLSTTFERDANMVPLGGHTYIRESNPMQSLLEDALFPLEGGAGALAFASGMAAGVALLQTLPAGAHVVFPDDAYYGWRVAAHDFLPQWGVTASFCPMDDLAAVRRAVTSATKLVFVETPSNPLLRVSDIAAIVGIARGAGARTAVDNTFATPVLQRPLDLGADVTIHSVTKYFGGHSDVHGGALIFRRRDEGFEKAMHVRHILGAVLAPFNAWLALRGLRSLAVRVAAHSAHALAVARALEGNPAVSRVNYPGLPSHPGHAIAARQMSGFGGMLSFHVKAGREAAIAAVGKTKLFVRATSLGAVESLIEHRATSEGPTSTTPQDLVRLSIGLEHPDDLIADLTRALG